VSLVSLFISLGGTGIAATSLADHGARAAHRKRGAASALTVSKVKQLIAAYVSAHRSQLTGPAGPAGATGATGAQGAAGAPGAQGPGATPILVNASSPTPSHTVATLGPWTITDTCQSSGAINTLTVTGPGTFYYTGQVGGINQGGLTTFQANAPTAGGYVDAAVGGQLNAQSGVLVSGSTAYHVDFQVEATGTGPYTCVVVGGGYPLG
jgi:hypothetical protein